MAVSIFGHIELAPPDAIFGLNAEYNNDPHPDKVNLGIGAYRTDEGKPYVLPVVAKVESIMADDKSLNHEYLPIEGLHDLSKGSIRLVLGADSSAIFENRVCGVQAISGTGAGRLAFEFIQRHYESKTVYISKPTWGNHRNMLKHAGYTDIREYRYFNTSTNGLDLDGMLEDLESAPEASIILLHGCAHNPCGVMEEDC